MVGLARAAWAICSKIDTNFVSQVSRHAQTTILVQASQATRPAGKRSVVYNCCNGPQDLRNKQACAKPRQPGQRQRDLESVKVGCKAHIVVQELAAPYEGISAMYFSEEKHTNHPRWTRTQVGDILELRQKYGVWSEPIGGVYIRLIMIEVFTIAFEPRVNLMHADKISMLCLCWPKRLDKNLCIIVRCLQWPMK